MDIPCRSNSGMRKQRGIVAIIMTIAMLAIFAVTALAIDVNHMYMNRTKLQNGVDAAALAAAVVLDNNSSQGDAEEAANATLTKLATTNGNSELDLDSATITVTFNSTAAFDGGACTVGEDCYVRVVVNNMDLQSFFMQMFTDTKQIAASAVAGPTPATRVCNLAPLTVCALDPDDKDNGGFDDDDDNIAIKVSSTNDEIGPGNFQLLDLDAETEGLNQSKKDDHLREQLAGGFQGCASIGGEVSTKPGNTVGPVAQGLNTRFDSQGNSVKGDYEPDSDSREGISHAEYEGNGRRMLLMPIIDCTPDESGKSDFTVTALGCFFMKTRAPTNNSGHDDIIGEYVTGGCGVKLGYNDGQSSNSGPYRIVLYKDPFNEDS